MNIDQMLRETSGSMSTPPMRASDLSELADVLSNQERKQNESLRYELFKDFLIDQFREDAIEEFWAILEVRNIEDWDSRLTEVLGEWDKEDRHFIIDVYNKIDE